MRQLPLPLRITTTTAPELPPQLQRVREFVSERIRSGYFFDARAKALDAMLARMTYDDAIVCDRVRLEYLYLAFGYPQYRLYVSGHVLGVADIRQHGSGIARAELASAVRQHMAAYLVPFGVTPDKATLKVYGARTDMDADTARQYRLFRVRLDDILDAPLYMV